MPELMEKVTEEVKCLPDEILEAVLDFIEYLRMQKERIRQFEAKYSSFDNLKGKIIEGKHTWEEEKDLFEWEAALVEVEKVKEILKE